MDSDYRAINFEGTVFPQSVMGISTLEPILKSLNEVVLSDDIAEWVWRFPICCGVTKTAPSKLCAKSAQALSDLMLENRNEVLEKIEKQFSDTPFSAAQVFSDWIMALNEIHKIATRREEDCEWSAQALPEDQGFNPKYLSNAKAIINDNSKSK